MSKQLYKDLLEGRFIFFFIIGLYLLALNFILFQNAWFAKLVVIMHMVRDSAVSFLNIYGCTVKIIYLNDSAKVGK